MKKLLKYFTLLLLLTVICQAYAQEQVNCHLPKNLLFSGEIVPMDIYISKEGLPSPSAFVYIELISRSGEQVMGKIFPVKEGMADAHLEVPHSIPSDNYLLSVYTRLGANTQNPEAFYMQPVSVINPFSPSQATPIKREDTIWQRTKAKAPIQLQIPSGRIHTGETFNISLQTPLPNQKLTVSLAPINPYLEWQSAISKPSSPTLPEKALGEYHGHIIEARVLESQPDTTAIYFLSVHGRQSRLYASRPNRQGKLYFDLDVMQEYDFVIFQKNKGLPPDAVLEMPFVGAIFPEYLLLPPLTIHEDDRQYLEDLALSASVSKYFYRPDSLPRPTWKTTYRGDHNFNLDDYTRFENMHITLREYVPTVLVRKQNKKTYFRLLNEVESNVFPGNPLILVDQMPVFDSHEVGAFNPEKFEKISVHNRRFFLGEAAFDGLLSISSFGNDFGGFPLQENALYIEYPPINPPLVWQLNRPVETEHYPDYRNVLYWKTQVETDEHGNLNLPITASQYKGTFELRVSYVDKEGERHFATHPIKIQH